MSNPYLSNLDGLDNLNFIGDELLITNNPELISFEMFKYIKDIFIEINKIKYIHKE